MRRIGFGLIALASVLVLISVAVSAQTMSGSAPAPAVSWPVKDETFVIKDFRFGTGEVLPELKLHYLTLGTAHRNAAGHVDNAVLLLHGTGGSAHSLVGT